MLGHCPYWLILFEISRKDLVKQFDEYIIVLNIYFFAEILIWHVLIGKFCYVTDINWNLGLLFKQDSGGHMFSSFLKQNSHSMPKCFFMYIGTLIYSILFTCLVILLHMHMISMWESIALGEPLFSGLVAVPLLTFFDRYFPPIKLFCPTTYTIGYQSFCSTFKDCIQY